MKFRIIAMIVLLVVLVLGYLIFESDSTPPPAMDQGLRL